MKLISIGQFDRNIIYPILGGIFSFIIKLLLSYDLTILTEHSLLLSINSSLGMSLAFIFVLLYKKKSKTDEISKPKNKGHNIELEYINQYEEIRYNKFKYILLSSIIDFIITVLICTYCIGLGINMWTLEILFIYLFSYIIFRIKIYRHHYISGLIILIFGIILNLIDRRYNLTYESLNPFLIKLFCEYLLSFALVINKFTMEKKFCSSYELCFYQGFITLIFYTIFLILDQFLKIIGDDLMEYYIDFKKSIAKETFMFLLVMFLLFFKNLFIFATIEKITPFHYLIILVIGELSSSIKNIRKKNIIENIFITICFYIIFFMILVFNEIIELKCFGLNKNTKKGISKRADMDNINKELRNESIFSEDESETITMEESIA